MTWEDCTITRVRPSTLARGYFYGDMDFIFLAVGRRYGFRTHTFRKWCKFMKAKAYGAATDLLK